MAIRRARNSLAITLGVEEEFFLVDPETRDLLRDPDPKIFEFCQQRQGEHKVVPEFLRSQIESNTRICNSVAQVRQSLLETRRVIVDAAAHCGAIPLAASTHPFATWKTQTISRGERYRDLATTYQQSVRQLLVGGMHVHLGFGDADSRIRVMTALRRYLPLIHALSGSSPFNTGHETGFKSYRIVVLGALPRTGVPRPLKSWADFKDLLHGYQRMRYISGGSELWWDIRPSRKFGTVEVRICDTCQRIDEAVTIVALIQSLVRHLLRLDRKGSLPEEPPTEYIMENRWLAARYGVLAFLGETTNGNREDIDDTATNLLAELADDARALGCEGELRGVSEIVRNGAGADRQVDHYRLQRLEGATDTEALQSVVDLVASETRSGI